jgi:hypothetical protein
MSLNLLNLIETFKFSYNICHIILVPKIKVTLNLISQWFLKYLVEIVIALHFT